MNDPNHQPPHAPVLHIAWVRWWSALAYHALTLAEGMEALGVASRVVAPPESPLARRAEALGLGAPEWSGLGSSSPVQLLPAIRRLRRGAARGRIRGVFAHTGVGHVAAALALHARPAPLLRVRADIRHPARGPRQRWLYTRATDRVLVSGDFMRPFLRDAIGIDAARLRTLPAGIDRSPALRIDREAARRRLRAEQGWPADALVVGMLARYSPVKGHRDLVEAARELAGRFDRVRFLAAGPPGQTGRERVAAWVRDAGLEQRFVLLDAVEHPLETAAAFDVAVIASRGSEAVCRSALEAMALGLAIVATRVHAIPETIGEAGLLVPPGEPKALADAVGQLLVAPERREILGEAARLRVEREFDRAVIARKAAAALAEAERERRAR